jgi:hypothetical protein
VKRRQNRYINPLLIRPFIDRLTILGVLPEVESYTIEWPDLLITTEEEKAKVAETVTKAVGEYVAKGVDTLIPPLEYLTTVLGMSRNEAEAILKAAEEQIEEEEESAEVREETTPQPSQSGQSESEEEGPVAEEVAGT